MDNAATFPEPPYYCVVFTSLLNLQHKDYAAMSDKIVALAEQQPGFIHLESARSTEGTGITVSYWNDEASILAWKANLEHLQAQKIGRDKWYKQYSVHISQVQRAYHFNSEMV